MSNKKAPCEGVPTLRNNSSQEYATPTGIARKICPSWEPEALREIIREIRFMASPERVTAETDSAAVFIPGAGVLHLHFDGTGGVKLDPESDFTRPMRELAQALRLVLEDRFTVGRPAGVTE